MGVLQRFERRIEELVNRPFARAFKAEVQPVEIASALQRECDDRAAIVARGRTMVPNAFTVELGPSDHERLSVYEQALADELAEMVRDHAREQGYAFIGPVTVSFVREQELETGIWLAVPATPELVFAPEEEMWRRGMREVGNRYISLITGAELPHHAALN